MSMRSTSMRSKLKLTRPAVLLSVVLTAAVLSPATAVAAAPDTTPTITSPADTSTVSTVQVTVSATSTATHVRFVLDGRVGKPLYDGLVAVDTGVATTSFSLPGLAGSTSIEAFDCDSLGSCNAVGDAISIVVDLAAPTITSPAPGAVVGRDVDIKAGAPAGSLQYALDGVDVGAPVFAPFDRTVSLQGRADGPHTITVRQCNVDGSVCEGATASVDVVKDTVGPSWTDLSASPSTVFPARDRYRDVTVLSARVGERSLTTKVQIRKLGGPLVRTITLGRVDAGRVRAAWNGHRDDGRPAAAGRYLFRFVGSDVHGNVGSSSDKIVRVSDKVLVRKTVTRTVSAKGSFFYNGSGDCSGVYSLDYPKARYDWPKGLGYYSRSKCNGNSAADTALALHRVAVPRAVRYGALRIDTYGGGAFRHAGPAVIVYVKANGDAGAGRVARESLGWHAGPSVGAGSYVDNGRVAWGFGAVRGNWFDVKEFRLTLRISVLR